MTQSVTVSTVLGASPEVGGDPGVATGSQADQRASWYDSTASMISLLKLLVAAYVGAGSRKYYYGDGTAATGNTPTKQLWKEAWVLFGVTRTKTYVYTADGQLDTESDWV